MHGSQSWTALTLLLVGASVTPAQAQGQLDPAASYAMATSQLRGGRGEQGLESMGRAAIAGSADAQAYMKRVCSMFDADNPDRVKSADAAFASLDGPFVGALSCEIAFRAAQPDTKDWQDAGYRYASAMAFFDDYHAIGEALLVLGESSDERISGAAVSSAADLCATMAGNPNDPNVGNRGVADGAIQLDRAAPVCETAAYLWPDNAALHHNLARIYMAAGQTTDADAANSEAQRLGYQLTVSRPAPPQTASGSGAPFVGSQRPAGQGKYGEFNRPDLLEAFARRDIAVLKADKQDTLFYMLSLSEVLHDPQAYFRVGGDYNLALDPLLEPRINYIVQTDGTLINSLGMTGLGSLWNCFVGLGDARQANVDAGRFDPGSEIAACNSGAVTPEMQKITIAKAYGTQDGIRLLLMWTNDPQGFKDVYQGIRAYVDAY